MSASAFYTPPVPTPSGPPDYGSAPATSSGIIATFRDAIREASPVWLRGKVRGGVLYAIAAQLDAAGDALVAGVKQRFPGFVSYESLPLIGRERRIRRGRAEPESNYAQRLAQWLDDHRRRGGPYAMLAQLFAHYAPSNFKIDLYYRSGRRFLMATDGTITRDTLGQFTYADWAYWTLVFYWPDVVTSDGIWSDSGTWDDGLVWDSSLTVQEASDIRLVPNEWNAAHCLGNIVLLQAGLELWDYPAGTWDEPGGVWLADDVVNIQIAIG